MALAAAATVLAGGCGKRPEARPPPDVVPVGVGEGSEHRPPATGPAVRSARPVGRLRCRRGAARRVGAHVELLARGRVVLLPAGVGIAPPLRRRGAYVTGGRCSYPARTREPTGVVELAPVAGGPVTLGELFALWGRPLGPRRLAGFRGQVATWVNGRRHRGDPRAVALLRHAVVVLQLGSRIPPHARYSFPPGL